MCFELNFSHGTHDDHRKRYKSIREIEKEVGRPIGVLADLQGPKLRLGAFADGRVHLAAGDHFELDLSGGPGTQKRVSLPHPEIFQALSPGVQLLLDDGKVRLEVETCDAENAKTRVIFGGALSDRKGVSVVGAILPLSPLTPKDRVDLAYALELGVDWIALSFVQHPDDVEEIRGIVAGRAGIMSKLEKAAAVEHLDAIVQLSDAVMVARGDLGVEMAPEEVPPNSTAYCASLPPSREAKHCRYSDVEVDDQCSHADPCRSVRCGVGNLSWCGCRDALRGIGLRTIPA